MAFRKCAKTVKFKRYRQLKQQQQKGPGELPIEQKRYDSFFMLLFFRIFTNRIKVSTMILRSKICMKANSNYFIRIEKRTVLSAQSVADFTLFSCYNFIGGCNHKHNIHSN